MFTKEMKMCGRFNQRATAAQLAEFFAVLREIESPPRYNIAPTQSTLVCRQQDEERELVPMRWGLIPSWSKDSKISYKLINARSETVAEKPSFRAAYKRRRCLIPASGFYEWIREGKEKQPFHIHKTDDSLFAMAGLWEYWDKGEGPIESFTILTTAANEMMSAVHHRMPVIIPPELFPVWLDEDVEPDLLNNLMQPYDWNNFEIVPVSKTVNNVRNETEECLQPR